MNRTAPPQLPDSAPFTPEQRAWLNGFLAALLQTPELGSSRNAPTPDHPPKPLLVGFGSQTGTAESIARRFAADARKKGFTPTLLPLNDVTPQHLADSSLFLTITSTWGDGDPPDNAATFWTRLNDPSAPLLPHLRFAVLGLGDRNYSDFCGAARKLDARLETLGAHRLCPRADCDTDYESTAHPWLDALWPLLDTAPALIAPQPRIQPQPAAAEHPPQPLTGSWSRSNPFPALLKTNRRLNLPGSGKEVRHHEILLLDSGLSYTAGDALGVCPRNDPALVEELLAVLGFSGDEIPPGEPALSIHQALMERWTITQPTPALLKELAARSPSSVLPSLLEPNHKPALDEWLASRDVLDALRAAPHAAFTPTEFIPLLKPLTPRLYSIASSPNAHPGEVHLTVGTVRYTAYGRPRKGVASTWLADRLVPGESPLPIFIQPAHNFRLPADLATPIIMVGPGTGIAPFRAFLEERRISGATGRNWLFFGDQCRATDFLYHDELTAMVSDGHLTRLDLAFSRDQAEKVYVQHRMLENAADLWSWLEAGAHFYVCGDARRMARDVHEALRQIVITAGGRSETDAVAYLDHLKQQKRYQRDVY